MRRKVGYRYNVSGIFRYVDMLEIVTFSAKSLQSMKRGYTTTTWKERNTQVSGKNVASSLPKNAKVVKSLGKDKLTAFIDRQGVLLARAVPQGQIVNSTYYTKIRKLSRSLNSFISITLLYCV